MTAEQADNDTKDDNEQAKTENDDQKTDGKDTDFTYGEDETQDFVDRDKIDFDPADGLYTGSAVTGDSDIPGPSEKDIREAQEEMDEDEDGDAGAKKAAEKYIEDNDVDLEEAQKGEAIAGSAKASGDKGDDS